MTFEPAWLGMAASTVILKGLKKPYGEMKPNLRAKPMESDSAYYARVRAELAHERGELRDATSAIASAIRQLSALREAASAVVARWDTPLWKDAAPTAEVIDKLRKALGSDNGQ